jgi:hypothetical protein
MNRLWRRSVTALRKGFSKDTLRRSVKWAQENVPPGLHSALGALLIVGGVFGFLPVLGFWMIPLGAALIALDIPPLRRRLLAWLDADQGHVGRN